ncbi:MAG: DnaJ family domain-containing protein [Thermodesulfovibrionales bacterium]
MDIFQKIAERKIQEAMKNGEFDNLPNHGKPLDLNDDIHVPQDLRMAYRVLKNAGCLPPELELRNEIISLRMMIDSLDDDRERTKKIRELNFKILRLNELRKRPFNLEDFPEYESKIIDKFIP